MKYIMVGAIRQFALRRVLGRELLYTKRFLKELALLPAAMQTRVEPIVFQALASENPFALGYLEKMKGYDDKVLSNGQIILSSTVDRVLFQHSAIGCTTTAIFLCLPYSLLPMPLRRLIMQR